MTGQQVSGPAVGQSERCLKHDLDCMRTLLLCNTDSGTMGAIWYSFSKLEAILEDDKLSLVVLTSGLECLSSGA